MHRVTTPTSGAPDLAGLLPEFATYREARCAFLAALGCDGSNRDPLAVFSEQIALAALGGTMAESRMQKGCDLREPAGRRVQVRYLTNPVGSEWLNGQVLEGRWLRPLRPRALQTAQAAGAVGLRR